MDYKALPDREFDLCIFGVTGFTGERVLLQLARQHYRGRIAACGRNVNKVKQVVDRAGGDLQCDVMQADVADYESLLHMASETRMVLACVGPYRLYGEPVVRACITYGTDYMDVCGEPEFMERMEANYFDHAASNGCFVLSAVGFDSVPAEFGCLFALQEAGMKVHAIESFLTLNSGPAGLTGNFATYESAVLGLQHAKQLRSLRKFLDTVPWRRPGRKGPSPPALKRRTGPYFDARLQKWALPFPGSDASVVRRQQQLTGRMFHYAAYFTLSTWTAVAAFAFWGTVAKVFAATRMPTNNHNSVGLVCTGPYDWTHGIAKADSVESMPAGVLVCTCWIYATFSQPPMIGDCEVVQRVWEHDSEYWSACQPRFGRYLLLKCPGFFSRGLFKRGGPTQKQIEQTSFTKTLVVHGFSSDGTCDPGTTDGNDGVTMGKPLLKEPKALPDRHVVCHVKGPEPGYVATPIILVSAALALQKHRSQLGKTGGVFTAGALLRNTDLIERLQAQGITFTVRSNCGGLRGPLSTPKLWTTENDKGHLVMTSSEPASSKKKD